jgi:hypothetical protein
MIGFLLSKRRPVKTESRSGQRHQAQSGLAIEVHDVVLNESIAVVMAIDLPALRKRHNDGSGDPSASRSTQLNTPSVKILDEGFSEVHRR